MYWKDINVLRKILPIQGGVGFSGFKEGFDKGERKFRGVEASVGAMLWDI